MGWGRAGVPTPEGMNRDAVRRAAVLVAAALALTFSSVSSAAAALSSFGSSGLTFAAGPTAVESKATGFARLTGAGMNVVRVEFPWQMIQPTNASGYDWSETDPTFAAMPAGVKAIALFNNAPVWARDAAAKSYCGSADPSACRTPPADARLKDWQRFIKAALARYGDKIVAVEGWNEPNLVYFWRPRVDPARWARLMHATATAARAARPGITMISGGLVGGVENDPTHSIGPIPFLDAAFAAVPGLAADIDLYGLHPYSRDACGSVGPESYMVQLDFMTDACASTGWDIERLRYEIRQRDPGSGIAVTEFGFHTGGPYAIDATTQRDWLLREYDWFNAQADIPMLVLHTLFDTSWAPSADEATYGLVDRWNQPKPAWTALHDKLAPGT